MMVNASVYMPPPRKTSNIWLVGCEFEIRGYENAKKMEQLVVDSND